MKRLLSIVVLVLVLFQSFSALAYGPKDPITITFWHSRGSGSAYSVLEKAIKQFNSSVGKEKGIIVKEVYEGGFQDCIVKILLSVMQGTNDDCATVASVGCDYVHYLLDSNLAADMAPFIKESDFDISSIKASLLNVTTIQEDHIYTLPYYRYMPVFIYNKTMADNKGLKAPKTMLELESFCKALYSEKKNGEVKTYGLGFTNSYINAIYSFVLSQGSCIIEKNKNGSYSQPCLEDGSLLSVFSDFKSWINDGWLRPFDYSKDTWTAVSELFYKGEIAAVIVSSNQVDDISKKASKAGFRMGCCAIPYYNEPAVCVGGADLFLVSNSNDEQLRAGWELIRYLLGEDRVVTDSISNGFIPFLNNLEKNKKLNDYWKENARLKFTYSELDNGYGNENLSFENSTVFSRIVLNALSELTLQKEFTPQDAIKKIQSESSNLF